MSCGMYDYVYDVKKRLEEKDQRIAELEGHIKGLTKVRNYEKNKHIRKRKRLQQQVADLEAKLAESEERAERYKVWHNEVAGECAELKQQLSEKEKELKQLKLDLGMFKSVNEFINRYGIEKAREVLLQTEETKKQDKISFAVEQLEEVKEILLENLYDLYSKPSEIWDKYGDLYDVVVEGAVNGTIDNQIKQLKEGK